MEPPAPESTKRGTLWDQEKPVPHSPETDLCGGDTPEEAQSQQTHGTGGGSFGRQNGVGVEHKTVCTLTAS